MTTRAAVDAERERLAALQRYRVLDTPPEEPFDRLARLAARVLGTPIAAVTLVDADRVWFKAEIGLGVGQLPRCLALCTRSVAGEGPIYELPDALADPTLRGNPLLEPPVGLRFYAGAALVTPDGFRIGTLCVIDRQPRAPLSAEQRATLVDLAGTVMIELERRRQQTLREGAVARLALINAILAEVGGAAGFVAAMEAAMRRLCAYTGAAFAHLWQHTDGAPVRRVASAADPGLPDAVIAQAFAGRPRAVPEAMFGPLLAGDAQVLAPQVTEADLADRPLLLDGYRRGMRAYLFHKWPVGTARYALLLKFHTARQDLPETAALLDEVGRAIRPALLHKQADERLALLNDVLAVIAGAPSFLTGIERSITLLCRHVGARDGMFWDREDRGALVRLVALAGAEKLPDALSERTRAAFPFPADASLLAPVMAAGGRIAVRTIPAALAEQYPLLRISLDAGIRSFAAQGFAVGDERYLLVLGFDSERGDLDEILDLLGEMAQAIRPAVQRKLAEDQGRAAEQQLALRTAQLAELARLARIGSWSWPADGGAMQWSEETFELLGVARATFTPTVDGFLALLRPEDAERMRVAAAHALRTGQGLNVEAQVPLAGGRVRAIVWNGRADRDAAGAVALRGYCQDVTERRETEAALHHGERLRALGKLTGGIAHEFSNLLTIVQANLELALDGRGGPGEARSELEAALRATQAGTALTARLLSFARAQPLRRDVTDLAAWLGPLRDMATGTLGQRHPVTLRADPDLPPVAVDRSQLEGAVLNLILNARDALPAGGPIAIEAERMTVPLGARGALADLPPGRYVAVAVRDGGAGMAADVAERAFEPFFTTKPVGSGTGLGWPRCWRSRARAAARR